MMICASCGHDVTGKKFCPECGTPVQPAVVAATCPRCHGEVKPGAAFCMHCGSALGSTPSASPATRPCPACQAQVSTASTFCTNCGHDMRAAMPPPSSLHCSQCGYQNAAGMRFCSNCGGQLIAGTPMQTGYSQPGQPQPYQQQPYQQPQYPQPYAQQPYQQPYAQPAYGQNAYQPQPMLGQPPLMLRCPTCMALAPQGSSHCVSCRTSLLGVVPTPASMPVQSQQGGFLQGNGGKFAMGALGGAAAVLGGEMLLHGIERSVEHRVEDDMGFGRHHHRDEGLLGGLTELADDIGL